MHEQSQMTGPASQNALIDVLREMGARLRCSISLNFSRKINFRITHIGGRALERPVSVQFTIDWDNIEKMRAYRDLVQDERSAWGSQSRQVNEVRLYVQSHRGVPLRTAARHILDWVGYMQTFVVGPLEGLQILPEGESIFRIDRHIAKLEAKKRRAIDPRPARAEAALDHLGEIVQVTTKRLPEAARLPDEPEAVPRYEIDTVHVRLDGKDDVIIFYRYQLADSRLKNRTTCVRAEFRSLLGSLVIFARGEREDGGIGPGDLMLLA